MLRSLAGAFVALGTLVAIQGPARAQDRPSPPELYLRDCSFCHGRAGEGTDQGPSLFGVGAASADFYLRTGRMPVDEEVQVAERGDPIYSEERIDELVRYVASLGFGPEIPRVDADAGSIGDGALLYQENCAACHGTAGAGAALTSGLVAPDLYLSSPIETAEAMRIGPGTMPVFGPDTLDDRQLNAIASYVRYLQEPEDRGGAPLGRIGPVTEGLVGWVVGLGSLLLAIRWIGTRAGS